MQPTVCVRVTPLTKPRPSPVIIIILCLIFRIILLILIIIIVLIIILLWPYYGIMMVSFRVYGVIMALL